mmetsp:Transcript_60125/g.140085  ORF Transcript_60125/g.140085 Transcript_60125/m.140085 type:complete len:95 (+) Transcript_60125:308-592(+)
MPSIFKKQTAAEIPAVVVAGEARDAEFFSQIREDIVKQRQTGRACCWSGSSRACIRHCSSPRRAMYTRNSSLRAPKGRSGRSRPPDEVLIWFVP